MRTFVDLTNMPNANPKVLDGMDSVSKGLVKIAEHPIYKADRFGWYRVNELYPECVNPQTVATMAIDFISVKHLPGHGPMNKVGKNIWRCIACGVGAYEVSDFEVTSDTPAHTTD